jgi:hypothetical protein
MIMKLLPIVPYVYYRGAVALRRNVGGFIPGPTGGVNESFATVGLTR